MSEQKIINFMGQRKIAAGISLILLLLSIGSLAIKGLNFGLDFTGGTLVEVNYSVAEPLQNVRKTLENAGYKGAVVVNFGSDTDVLVRLPHGHSDQLGNEIIQTLSQDVSSEIELRRVEFVGPQVGDELKEQGGLAMLMALGLVMLYVALRFQFKFSVGAVSALIHDVIITLGIFSILQVDFDLTVLAAVLAVIGYSLNDTIVVSDRIRENFRKVRKASPIEIINISLTETLARTLVTSLTTLLVLIALFVFGGELIHGFAMALLIGVFVGTYSSIYVAANVLLAMDLTKEDLIPPQKEGGEVDELP
ncbi:protein translocase subunit SecF [Dasania sp. GY-MA-18]|uniref:Protein-export membrane protein SecF n=1 Tax=Dasania phycosphaerae TaxID=2950436 RepID=A0A9J6RQV1_9GAMM|nr:MULTISPECIES: protein translocase subunit SecF [Dasania]MCR8924199.1 protein translocase subunit SecF [Dasania sp. GY-MA-18]MCZ0866852.1 protein translocase subunit SecF [Dasania phycosphaerae]MCZ0870357.1 protein translocase subunit SecF [Dasania phycosphaerae]